MSDMRGTHRVETLHHQILSQNRICTANRDANRLSNEINRQSSITHDEFVNFFSSFFIDSS